MESKTLLVLAGPTGIGKTDLSIQLAKHFNTEIVSSDSRQLYKELDIGTAPPSAQQLAQVKHHFIKTRSVTEEYTAGKYEFDALEVINNLFKTNNVVWLVGGSGLYIDAVCRGIDNIPATDESLRNSIIKRFEEEGIEGLRFDLMRLDPDICEIIDIKNPQRVMRALEVCITTGKTYSSLRKNFEKTRPFRIIKIGLQTDRDILYNRINQRVDNMMEQGLLEEVKNLYPLKNCNALKTVGYRELFDYLENKTSLDEAVELIKRNTRRYAKRQITWFNRYPEMEWFHPDDSDEICNYIQKQV